MKVVFLGFIYFGWWYGWQALPPVFFDDFEKCRIYSNELVDHIEFHKKHGQLGIKNWDLTCKTVFPDAPEVSSGYHPGNFLP